MKITIKIIAVTIVYLLGFQVAAVVAAKSVDITVTDSLIYGKTEFFTQSSSGSVTTCGVEFNGTDAKLNHFVGSYGFMLFDKRGIFSLFKIKSLKIDYLPFKRFAIKSAWIASPSASTSVGKWVRINSGDSFLVSGTDPRPGMGIYEDLVSGKGVKVGYLHEGETIDRVYKLATFSPENYKTSMDCLLELLETSKNRS